MLLSKEEGQVLNKLARRKNPNYHYMTDEQFISSVIFLKRDTSSCLICNKEISINALSITEHGFFHLKELNLMVFI